MITKNIFYIHCTRSLIKNCRDRLYPSYIRIQLLYLSILFKSNCSLMNDIMCNLMRIQHCCKTTFFLPLYLPIESVLLQHHNTFFIPLYSS